MDTALVRSLVLLLAAAAAAPAQMMRVLPAGGAKLFPNGYANCRVVTTSNSMVSGASPLSSYPLAVIVTSTDLATSVNGGLVNDSNGYDIGFYNDTNCSGAGVKMNWEMESYTATSGALVAHVGISSLSNSANTLISMYYGGAYTSFQSTPTAVWNANYKGVWHLPNGVSFSGADSVASGHTMTSAGGVTPGVGKIDGAGVFGATNGYTATSAFTLSATPNVFSIEAWTKITSGSLAGRNTIFGTTPNNTGGNWSIELGSQAGVMNNTFEVLVAGNNVKKATENSYPTDGNWHHIALTRNGSGDTFAFYLDGVSVGAQTPGGTSSIADFGDSGQTKQIGVRTTPSTQLFQGSLDEVRYSDVVRSADWIKTEFRNLGSPATYITLGSRVTP